MKESIGFIKDRLTSEKFWEGIAIVVSGVGVYINPEAAVEVAASGAVIVGAIRAISNNWSKIFKKDVPED